MNMKLSEAIRLGAMLHQQGFNVLRSYAADNTTVIGTCAMGAAEEAGYRFEGVSFPLSQCPIPPCGCRDNIHSMVVHLNDRHHWTREAIADWVATVEPVDAPAPAPVRAPAFVAAFVIACLVSVGCGDLNPTMAPSVTTVGCAGQRAGSTVSILDVTPSC